jgi:hypothetical protein
MDPRFVGNGGEDTAAALKAMAAAVAVVVAVQGREEGRE